MIHHFSYPRSGVQLLIWILLKYSSKNVYYPYRAPHPQGLENYTVDQILGKAMGFNTIYPAGELTYCQFGARKHLTKEQIESVNYWMDHNVHDALIEPLHKDVKYIIQYRNPIIAALSSNKTYDNPAILKGDELLEHMKYKVDMWKRFVHKHVIDSMKTHYRLSYEDFVREPKVCLIGLISYLEMEYDSDLLDKIIEHMDISVKEKYWPELYSLDLKKIEDTVADELKQLNIDRVYK